MRKNEAKWDEKNKRWRIQVQKEGKRRSFEDRTPGPRGKAAAERKADKWFESGATNENTLCDDLLDLFYEKIKLTTGTSQKRTTESFIRIYIKPRIGALKIGRLTQNNLQAIIDHAYGDREGKYIDLDGKYVDKNKNKLSEKTLKNLRSTIMSFMKFCRGEGCTQFHPETLTIPASAEKSQKTILGIDDLIKLFTISTTTFKGEVVEDRFIHAYRFAVVSGMRPGEVCGFRHTDLKDDRATVYRSINGYQETTSGKNQNATRTYKLGWCAQWVLECQKRMLIELGQISPFVFPGADLSNAKQDTVYRAWKKYCRVNEITVGTQPYEMRHTFVSVNTDMPEFLKQLVLGHSKNMDTHGVYGHEKAGDMDKAAAYIDAAFKEILGKALGWQ